MKLLMTADCVGGVWSYATTLCGALQAFDVEVTLAVTGGPMSESQRAEAASLGNVELHHRPYKCEWMIEPWADVAAAGRWLDGLAEACAPDVIHLNDYAHGGRALGGRPRLMVLHSDVFSWHWRVLGHQPDPQRWLGYACAALSGLRAASLVVAPTAAALADSRRYLNHSRQGVTVWNAVDAAGEDEPRGGREAFVLCAGRLWDEAKNVRALATAADGLRWPVRVAGRATGPDGGTASFPNVELLGPLPHGELMRLMSRAAIYALPAKYEPFGLSAVEAGLRGCALVLGDIPSLREVWADAALFVPPDDAAALRATLLRLVGDDGERRHLSRLARARAATYTPAAQARRYVELYESLTLS